MKNHCKKNSKKGNKKCICCNKAVAIIAVLALLVVGTAIIYAIQNSQNQVTTPPTNGGDVVVGDGDDNTQSNEIEIREGWNAYKNENLGLHFEYPSNWELSEYLKMKPKIFKSGKYLYRYDESISKDCVNIVNSEHVEFPQESVKDYFSICMFTNDEGDNLSIDEYFVKSGYLLNENAKKSGKIIFKNDAGQRLKYSFNISSFQDQQSYVIGQGYGKDIWFEYGDAVYLIDYRYYSQINQPDFEVMNIIIDSLDINR